MTNSTDEEITVSVISAQAVCWGAIVLFLLLALFAAQSKQSEVAPFFLIFVAIGVFASLNIGPVKMTASRITYLTPLGKYEMHWAEVISISIDNSAGAIVFHGEAKRLAAIGPRFWSGPNRNAMLQLLKQQIDARNIPLKRNGSAAYTLSRKTRV
jgi:hypothetical protein